MITDKWGGLKIIGKATFLWYNTEKANQELLVIAAFELIWTQMAE